MKRYLFVVLTIVLISGNLNAGQNTDMTRHGSKETKFLNNTWTEPLTGMEFIWIPEGTFSMGTPEAKEENSKSGKNTAFHKQSAFYTIASYAAALFPAGCVSSKKGVVPEEGFNTSDERPAHRVHIKGFWIGKNEVTQGQWKTIMVENPSYFNRDDGFPVETISWYDAKAYINKLNSQSLYSFRLPTEEEWEYAARSGGKSQKYAGGDIIDTYAWFRNNCRGTPHEVCTKAPNGLGLYDMSGNVWEWCEDIYYEDQYLRKQKASPIPILDPEKLKRRVCRGGCYLNTWPNIRCSNRHYYNADYKFLNIGFRLVREGAK